MTTTVHVPMLADARPLLRFLRTPKALTIIVFVGLLAVASLKLGDGSLTERVVVAALAAAAIDVVASFVRRREFVLPDGAVLTGMIVAFILRPQESWLILLATVAVAISCKHVVRTRWSNVLNPAAFALVIAALFFNTGQDWWGALPDLGMIGALVLIVAGGLIADRINKLPMILAFFGTYFGLFAVASLFRSSIVAETFLTPDLQAALFFGFFMLDDPPTSPVRHEDQLVYGVIVALVSYFVFMQYGGVYFLPAGLLAGNLWESGRRLVHHRIRNRQAAPAGAYSRQRVWLVGNLGTAAVVMPLLFVSGIFATSSASSTPTVTNPYPFKASFQDDFKGTYAETNDANSGHLVLDGSANGDLSVGVHVEILQQRIIPTPDDEGAEALPDDEQVEAQPIIKTQVNKAQLLAPTTKDLLCDGTVSALRGGLMRFACDGLAAYAGVQMQVASQLDAAQNGTFNGSLNGIMQRSN